MYNVLVDRDNSVYRYLLMNHATSSSLTPVSRKGLSEQEKEDWSVLLHQLYAALLLHYLHDNTVDTA